MPERRRPSAALSAPVLLLILAACFLASCRRSPATASSAARPDVPAARPASVPEAKTRTPGRLPAATSPAAAPHAATPAAPAGNGAGGAVDPGVFSLLCRGAQDGTLPEDFEIGPLAAPRLLETDARAAYHAAAALLDAFAQGRVERTQLAAGSRDALAGMLAFALERGDRPAAWRLGLPRLSGTEWVANLRLLATAGSAEGELYARREAADLLVTDLQIDPARMRVRRERSGRTFFPSPYRWLLGG